MKNGNIKIGSHSQRMSSLNESRLKRARTLSATHRNDNSVLSLSQHDPAFLPLFGARNRSKSTSHVIAIKPPFYNEVKAESISRKHYLTIEERKAFKIQVEQGVFRAQSGNFLNGSYLYVLMPNFELYAFDDFSMHHSYVSAGLEVMGSGYLYFFQGTLICFSNESGHYKPTTEEMQDAIHWFFSHSKNPHLVFEDHSQQSNFLPYNGINFHQIIKQGNSLGICQLDTDTLICHLNEGRNRGIHLFNKRIKAESPSLQKNSRLDPLIKEPDYVTEVVYKKQTISGQENKFDKYPELQSLTCINRLYSSNSNKFSRFNGAPRLKQGSTDRA